MIAAEYFETIRESVREMFCGAIKRDAVMHTNCTSSPLAHCGVLEPKRQRTTTLGAVRFQESQGFLLTFEIDSSVLIVIGAQHLYSAVKEPLSEVFTCGCTQMENCLTFVAI